MFTACQPRARTTDFKHSVWYSGKQVLTSVLKSLAGHSLENSLEKVTGRSWELSEAQVR